MMLVKTVFCLALFLATTIQARSVQKRHAFEFSSPLDKMIDSFSNTFDPMADDAVKTLSKLYDESKDKISEVFRRKKIPNWAGKDKLEQVDETFFDTVASAADEAAKKLSKRSTEYKIKDVFEKRYPSDHDPSVAVNTAANVYSRALEVLDNQADGPFHRIVSNDGHTQGKPTEIQDFLGLFSGNQQSAAEGVADKILEKLAVMLSEYVVQSLSTNGVSQCLCFRDENTVKEKDGKDLMDVSTQATYDTDHRLP